MKSTIEAFERFSESFKKLKEAFERLRINSLPKAKSKFHK